MGITFRPGIGITYVTTIRNRHSETVDRALVSRNSVPGPKFRCGACVLVHRLSYLLGRTRIFGRPAIGTAREAPIRNRHVDPVGTRSYSDISGPAPKFFSGSVVARLPRLCESLVAQPHGFGLSRRSEVVFNSARELVPRT
ncbi:hypothetical protein Taro_001506 [Colocasia esculenta]|uniref:Uncharacterized protein n=1 Tax=Colocasia esculenta TaxID=4460 RepID=A0A843TB60_COLES|nr:hypothetical protein [Colocasia esculenta]